ncbi:putative harbinger transposase-derived protein [Tanacetum coccineum]
MFPEAILEDMFRMSRSLFTGIVEELTLQCEFFRKKEDCTGKLGISPLIMCTSAICQLAYGTVPDALDEYLQMGNATSRQCLENFCTSFVHIFGPEFLRKLTLTDVERLYAFHENKHGFPEMLGSLDCTDWAWFGCPIAHKAQYCRRDHGPDPFILLEAEWVPFVKSVTNLADDDYKRLQYKTMHEAARKDVERAFDRKEAISPKWYPEEEHQPDDLLRSDEQRYRVIRSEFGVRSDSEYETD